MCVCVRARAQALVASLANKNVLIVSDNHIRMPDWCRGNFDRNGFFRDQYFNRLMDKGPDQGSHNI